MNPNEPNKTQDRTQRPSGRVRINPNETYNLQGAPKRKRMNPTTPMALFRTNPNEQNDVVFIRVPFASFRRALGFVRIIRVRLVHSCAPWMSSSSFGFVEFIRTRPGSSRVHLCSLGSFGRGPAKGVLGFIRVRWVWSLVSFDVLWVHSGATWGSSGSFRFVGFIRARPGGRCVRSGSLGSFMHGLGDIGFIGFVWFTLAHLMGLRVHLGSVGLFWRADSVVGPFVLVNKRPRCRRVQLGFLGSLVLALGVIGFIRV